MTDFLPTVTRSFASHSGDTIQLELLESSNTISTLHANEAQSDKGFDYIETDNYEYLYGNDSIDILFDYALKTEYDASLENLTKGLLNIELKSLAISPSIESMDLVFDPFENCASVDCFFQDSILMQDSTIYTDVYFSRMDTTNAAHYFYFNKLNGIISFKWASTTYTLIP